MGHDERRGRTIDDIPALWDLPEGLRASLAGAVWRDVTFGYSGDHVFHVVPPAGAPCYLKIATHPWQRRELHAERDRLAWLSGRLPAPAIRAFSDDGSRAYLLLSEIPGVMACDDALRDDIPRMVRLLAEGLRLIHAVDTIECPFDARLDGKLRLAEERVRAGLVDEADFDTERQGMRAADLFAELLRTRPATEDLVFTHGDYCLPNVLLDRTSNQVSGFVDWGRAGVADRYQDLALAARSLAYNFGLGWEPLLWEAYGLAAPDEGKLAFYRLLDEFF